MHVRKLILSVAVSLFAVTAAYADVTPAATAQEAGAPAAKKVLQHLTPKPSALLVDTSAGYLRTRYTSLEFGLLTVGTLTTGSTQQMVK